MSVGGGMYVLANDLTYAEHTGTHMDAPIHFSTIGSDQWYSHNIPPDRLVHPSHISLPDMYMSLPQCIHIIHVQLVK